MSYSDFKELITDAKQFATGATDLQLKSKLLELINGMYELLDENRNLRLENEQFKNKSIDYSKLEWKEDAYYSRSDPERLYCSRCVDKDGLLISMHKQVPMYSSSYTAICPECKTEVATSIKHGMDTDFSM